MEPFDGCYEAEKPKRSGVKLWLLVNKHTALCDKPSDIRGSKVVKLEVQSYWQ
ncbi:hypothetical protein VARIO8X_90067 [Burkholderiales bacterium 8X]|nr:hypothetical protein VARIO8X_90067 [Burkholderiales bacterium 8X]